MRIEKMTATFGGLEQAELAPSPGLTVIAAPNESGKSTWAGFWRAMLYGIDTKERDKVGFLADKNRYQPWSGAPMAGELQAQWQGKEITIRRFAAKSSPFGGFEAVYTATGDPVPGLTAANVGEQLTGVGREVYLRSAFVGQGGARLTHSGELEARIAALATAGQEDVSYSGVERTLKDWRNRRRANRSSGLIPELEGQLAQTEQTLRDMSLARRRREEAAGQIGPLESERAALQADLAVWQRLDQHALNRRYGQAQEEQTRAEAALANLLPPDPETADWPAQRMADWAAEEERNFHQAQAQREEVLAQRAAAQEKNKKVGRIALAVTLILVFIGVAIGILGGLGLTRLNPNIILYLLLAACAAFLFRSRQTLNTQKLLAGMVIPEEPVPEDWQGQARRHADYLAQKERLTLEARHARLRVEDLAAQGASPCDTMEFLSTPTRSRQETAARLGAVEQELARCRNEVARAEGQLSQMGDPEALEAHRDELSRQLAGRLAEFDAITTAMEALSAANDSLRERFSPALNQAAGDIFSALTGGRYPAVSLARDFSAQATQAGELLPRADLALSTGTVEQLYLAVRLAICQLTLPGAPILLDDALTAFDDGRMALALDYLKALGQERQILLFSCHRREADWAQAHGVPVLTL